MGPLDAVVVGTFLAATFLLGIRSARGRGEPAEEYLLAGRSLGLGLFTVTLVATWYGGVLGVGEYSYRHGLSNWIVLGVPYYVGALLFALLFAARAREAGEFTVPDLLFRTYGRGAGLVGTAVVFALSLPAAYLLMLGVLLRRATGLDQRIAILFSAAFCLAYIVARGFRSVVGTKTLQFALMYGGFAILLPIAVARHGGTEFLRDRLPAEAFTWHGGRTVGYVAAWYFIALQTLVEPTFFQRCFAARSARIARRGILAAVFCFLAFDGLTTWTGMYARAVLPPLPSPVDAFPALGEALLPPPFLGLFYAGLLATILSTVDSFLFVGGVTLGRDLVWRLSEGKRDQLRWTRIGLAVAAVLASGIAMASESVVSLWYGFGSVGTAVLLPPLLGVFYPKLRPSPALALAGMAIAGAVTTSWIVSSAIPGARGPWLGIEPVYPGLLVAAALQIVGILVRRRLSLN